jgi:hypothetical protein
MSKIEKENLFPLIKIYLKIEEELTSVNFNGAITFPETPFDFDKAVEEDIKKFDKAWKKLAEL